MRNVKFFQILLLTITITAVCANNKISLAENSEAHSTMMPITCELNCREKGRHIWADATFSNATEMTMPVFKEALLKVKDLEGAGFRVKRDGKNVPYQGILIKRPPPRIDEYYPVKPHEVLKVSVEISKYFDFSESGEYVIRYSCISMALPLNGTNLLKIESNQVVLKRK